MKLIKASPVPKTAAELALVLGFFGYYRESVVNFSELTSQMNTLKTKKVWEPGDWTSKMQTQFDTLKRLFL